MSTSERCPLCSQTGFRVNVGYMYVPLKLKLNYSFYVTVNWIVIISNFSTVQFVSISTYCQFLEDNTLVFLNKNY